jgi:prephenate dehydratase
VTTPSTAAAAELVARGDGTDLAVGCRVCADMYEKLEILAEGIQEEAGKSPTMCLLLWMDQLIFSIENTTRFLLLGTSSLDRIPTELTSRQESRAFLRVLLRPQDAVSFVIMACQPEAEVMQVDRIPAPEMNPFTSVYFIEIQRKESDKHLYSEDTLKWRRCVEDVSRRIQDTGTQVTILGWL